MLAQIFNITKDHVAQRTALDADVLLLAQVLQVREELQLEAVANALRTEHDSVLEVLDVALVSLTCMEERGHLLIAAIDDCDLFLIVENCLGKRADFRREVLLVHHVEARDELGQAFVLQTRTNLDVVEHLLHVTFTDDLQSRKNQTEVKVRVINLQLVNDLANDGKLGDKVLRLLVIIEQHARDVAVLDDEHILLNACCESASQQIFEERDVFTQLANLGELVLERLPNVV